MSIGANHASYAWSERRRCRGGKPARKKQRQTNRPRTEFMLETKIHSLVFHLIILGFAY